MILILLLNCSHASSIILTQVSQYPLDRCHSQGCNNSSFLLPAVTGLLSRPSSPDLLSTFYPIPPCSVPLEADPYQQATLSSGFQLCLEREALAGRRGVRLGYLFPGTLPARMLDIPSLKVTAPIRKLSSYNFHVLSSLWFLVSATSPLSFRHKGGNGPHYY